MILVTSPTGRTGTGQHVIAALLKRGQRIRTFAPAALPELTQQGVAEQFIGDLLCREDLRRACEGIETVIHTGPMSEDEPVMGRWLVEAAKAAGVKHFVYHSVIHPQTEWLLNHHHKTAVEDRLIDSGIPFTILQPMHYFQNIDVRRIIDSGVYVSPYSPAVGLSHVDVADLAEVSAKVAGDPAHFYATYEICGNDSDHLNTEQLVEALSRHSGKKIENRQLSIEEFLTHVPGTEGYMGNFLIRVMSYYNRFGIRGNANVLSWLLGRKPTTLQQYLERMYPAASIPRS